VRQGGAILHYSLPPVVGGVENVIMAHAQQFIRHGYPISLIAGRGGDGNVFTQGARIDIIPELDTNYPEVMELTARLNEGVVPENFSSFTQQIAGKLGPLLDQFSWIIVHNIFSKHFNLALTAALSQLAREGRLHGCIAWCHDITWTSEHSRSKVYPRYPWDLLRTPIPGVRYIVVSKQRQKELAQLFSWTEEKIQVISNGVDPASLLGLSVKSQSLVERVDLLASDLILLMPVRITQAKNIELALSLTAELKARGCKIRLLISGPPDPHDRDNLDYFHELQSLKKDLDVDKEACFLYECGPVKEEPFIIGDDMIGDLYRLADLVFLPSHREGFGMPVLEGGLVGVPVMTTGVPAAREIGGQDVMIIDASSSPAELANQILGWAEENNVQRLRRRMRQGYTWKAIFENQIEPLINSKSLI
jgi:glycosyltransferase involved in cell wall biosynthesis